MANRLQQMSLRKRFTLAIWTLNAVLVLLLLAFALR